jgi:putative tricarboxylic transport membrane protein
MTTERVASLVFFAAGIYAFIFSIQLPMGRWNDPGPGIYPFSLSIILCISGISWFIYGKRKDDKKTATFPQIIRKYKVPIQIVFLTFIFILTLNRAGYLLNTILYLFMLLFWVSRYRLWSALGLALCIGVGSWYFFGKLLSIQLPKGLWIF